MKKAEKEYLSQVASLGCLICQQPAQIHHIRNGMGTGQRNSHKNTIPLCHIHHTDGGFGVAFHAGKKTWQAIYGTEQKLLERVQELLKEEPYYSV